jgi:DNA-binding beta-propeller fold protein YncE
LNRVSGNVQEIDAATNQQIASIAVGQHNPGQMIVTPDGSTMYITAEDAMAVLNLQSGVVTTTIDIRGGGGMAFSPSGSVLYVSGSNLPDLVYGISTSTNEIATKVPNSLSTSGYAICVSPNGEVLYVGAGVGLVTVSTETNTITGTIGTGVEFLEAVVISPDGTEAYGYGEGPAPSYSPVLARYNLTAGTLVGTSSVGGLPAALALSSNANTLYVLLSAASVLDTVSASTTKAKGEIHNVGNMPFVITSGDGTLVAASDGAQAALVDTATHQVTSTVSLGTTSSAGKPSFALNSNGTMGFAPFANDDLDGQFINFVDLTTGVITASVTLPGTEFSQVYVALSPNNATLYAYFNNNLCPIDVAEETVGTCIAVSGDADIMGRPMAVSSDSTKLYVIASETTLEELNAETLKTIKTLSFPTSEILANVVISTSQNSLYLTGFASTGKTSHLYRIDLDGFTTAATTNFSSAEATDIAVTSDGSEVYIAGVTATGSTLDNLCDVFDATTLALTQTLTFPSEVVSVTAAPQ